MSEQERLQALEEEQDQLNSSLLALTSHFAQVQFRLKQIVDTDGQEKEVKREHCSIRKHNGDKKKQRQRKNKGILKGKG